MGRPLPPWLNIAPSQFTEAAISGAQLGAKGATEAAQLGLEAAKVAQQAQELQARRDAISAQFAAVNQRASEASMENAIRNRQAALQEKVSKDAGARMAANDTVWQEGMSRYERAVNAGDDKQAAQFEILEPLRMAGFGGGDVAIKPPGGASTVAAPRTFEMGNELIEYDPLTRRANSIYKNSPVAPEMTARQRLEYNDLLSQRRAMAGKEIPGKGDVEKLAKLEDRIKNFFGTPKASTATPQFNEGQRIRNRRTGNMGTYRGGQIIPDSE